ncbi:MAG: formylglycine-generating enzyme family protein [Prevotella sp.]|nr:formylglycine-generating enzyme family protein [Prevotella sp.]
MHQVTLSSFSICKYEVTQELWQAVMGNNPSSFKGNKLPVERVSWEDCQQFITLLNQKTGKNYRLPTEAEWEYAARGGNLSHGYKYAGSDSLDVVGWYANHKKKHDVGTKRANELGLYDMSGNVWEWCSDCYGKYDATEQTNPQGSSSGSTRIFRGGSWSSEERLCRVTHRGDFVRTFRSNDIGLRLVL